MSKKEVQNTEKEKVMTKYDLKVQRREAEKAKAERDKKISTVVGIIVVAALVCLVASFPVRTYLAVNETYVKVNGENVSRVEFDYNYNVAANNYINQYGSYMSMFGVDLSQDPSSQMYSDTLTFADYFEQLAIENIKNNKALMAEAKAAGFEYDTTADFADFKQSIQDAAAEAGVTQKDFICRNYGTYATMSRIEAFVKEAMYVGAYYDSVADAKEPSDEDAQAYYNDNSAAYDSVDYRVLTVSAELPEEPTEEQKTAAMAAAKEEAEEAVKTVAKDGELKENMTGSSVPYLLKDWLFDSARKAGDTTVIENTSGNSYYVAAFENRYLDNTPTVNIRAILTTADNGQAVLDEWTAGAATEESFAELCDKYNDTEVVPVAGGLFDNLQASYLADELAAWLSDSSRKPGDTTVISPADDEYTYVLYYVSAGDPQWMVDIKNTLLSDSMEAYLEEIAADIAVEDPKGNLDYLKVPEEEETADGSEAAESTEAADSSAATESSSAQ